MNRTLLLIASFTFALSLSAQSRSEEVVREIEQNSLRLKALSEQLSADKFANRTSILPPNPELLFNYVWARPAILGNRTDFSAIQRLDFPTVYSYRAKIASLANSSAELRYQAERIELLLSAKECCIQLTYLNALEKLNAQRLQSAKEFVVSYTQKLAVGDCTILELNRAKLTLSTLENEAIQLQIERQGVIAELMRLNGGVEIRFDIDSFDPIALTVNFEEWFGAAEERSPLMAYLKREVEISEKQVDLSRAMGLPKLAVGYMTERQMGQNFDGVTIGLSIPLWENKNRVKQAKASAIAAQTLAEEGRQNFYAHLQNLFLRASTLQNSLLAYRTTLDNQNSELLLNRALEGGEITLLEYLLEMQYLFNARHTLLTTERDFALTVAQLAAVEG